MVRVCEIVCGVVFAVLCLAAVAADDWRDRFEKFRALELSRAKNAVTEWEGKLKEREKELAAAKAKNNGAEIRKAQAAVASHKVDLKNATDYVKDVEAKGWVPRKVALRTIEKGEFSYMIDAPVKVIQALPDGALVSRASDTFFIRGLGDVVDGREYKMNGFIECTGTYKYTAVSGAARTVVALELHGK